MPNVIAINAAAKKHIAAAQATSDEMLLEEHCQGRPHRDACALFPP